MADVGEVLNGLRQGSEKYGPPSVVGWLVGCTQIYRAHVHSDGKEVFLTLSLQEVGTRNVFQSVGWGTPFLLLVRPLPPTFLGYTHTTMFLYCSTATLFSSPCSGHHLSPFMYHDTYHLLSLCWLQVSLLGDQSITLVAIRFNVASHTGGTTWSGKSHRCSTYVLVHY